MIEYYDIMVACQFLSPDSPRLIIQYTHRADVPYIKRAIIGVLGTPDNDINDVLKYTFAGPRHAYAKADGQAGYYTPQGKIAIVPAIDSEGYLPLGWSDRQNVFYIGEQNKHHLYELYMAGVRSEAVPESHIVMLKARGYNYKEILDILGLDHAEMIAESWLIWKE